MIPDSLIFGFSPEENEAYDAQARLAMYDLPDAKDELDQYSCHSQPHVAEVMRECDRLLAAFAPWLADLLHGFDMDYVRTHLLLAAKLHDIGMKGTPDDAALLRDISGLSAHIKAFDFGDAASRALSGKIAARASNFAKDSRACRDFLRMYESGDLPAKRAAACLAGFHDDIKSRIRSLHAARSSEYVLENSDALKVRYGEYIDTSFIALLAAMHSGECESIAFSGKYAEKTLEFMANFIGKSTLNMDFRVRTVAIASLLRLADTRRSGSETRALDKSLLRLEKSPSGDVELYKFGARGREHIALSRSLEILIAEACTEFGGVSVERDGAAARVVHDITFRFCDNDDIARAVGTSRLGSYIYEIESGAFSSSGGFEHTLRLKLPECSSERARGLLREWDFGPCKAVLAGK